MVVGPGGPGSADGGPGAPDLAVEDSGDHDQGTLEEVLPGLAEVEEDGRVEHLDDETGTLARLIGRPTTPLADAVAATLKN